MYDKEVHVLLVDRIKEGIDDKTLIDLVHLAIPSSKVRFSRILRERACCHCLEADSAVDIQFGGSNQKIRQLDAIDYYLGHLEQKAA